VNASPPEIVAHRGASAYAPENTLAAYDLALEQGADILELDVRSLADGSLVVAHDPTLERTHGDARRLDRMGASELAALPSPPPEFDTVLARYAGRTGLLVDLKDPAPAMEACVVAALDAHGAGATTAVQSFDHAALRRVKRLAPSLGVVALYSAGGPRPHGDLAAVATFASGIGPWQGWVDAPLVAAARARGLRVRPWTVDDPAAITRLAGLGVDGVITNAPDVARAALGGPPPAAVAAA
jgi:glycerophosphoryl diester phosphodiesterase